MCPCLCEGISFQGYMEINLQPMKTLAIILIVIRGIMTVFTGFTLTTKKKWFISVR